MRSQALDENVVTSHLVMNNALLLAIVMRAGARTDREAKPSPQKCWEACPENFVATVFAVRGLKFRVLRATSVILRLSVPGLECLLLRTIAPRGSALAFLVHLQLRAIPEWIKHRPMYVLSAQTCREGRRGKICCGSRSYKIKSGKFEGLQRNSSGSLEGPLLRAAARHAGTF